jgi:hypothetical protein
MGNLAVFLTPQPLDHDEQLAAEITLLAGQINVANYRLLKLIAEFDDRKGWSGGGTVRSCAHWLNWKVGIALGAAREKVRVAHCLQQLPLIDAAFATGEISYSKVRAMTRVATPDNEDFLLTIARYGTASHVEQVVNKYRGVQRSRDDSEAEEQEQARKLVYYQDDNGMWVIHARLPAEAGAIVVKAIEAVAKPVQEARQEQLKEQPRDVPAGTDCVVEPSARTERLQDLLEQTRADALVTITEHFLASSGDNTRWQGLKGSERCQLMLHVDINTLREHGHRPEPVHEHCNLDKKRWISPATARRLSCDTSLITVLEDERGKVLNIGRRSRTVPASIGRALALRDSTCRFPGCCESRYVDAHHIRHWADGGETSLDNLVTLCRYHHRKLHEGAFDITVKNTGNETQLVFSTPSGKAIQHSVYPQFKSVPAETCDEYLSKLAPEVHSGTAVSRWQGEDCDYGMAIDALLRRDRG